MSDPIKNQVTEEACKVIADAYKKDSVVGSEVYFEYTKDMMLWEKLAIKDRVGELIKC